MQKERKSKMKYLKHIITTLLIIIIPIIIILTNFSLLLYNQDFYEQQFEENGVYNNFQKDKVLNATQELWGYMQDKNNLTTSFFSEQDKAHMIDVKVLINKTLIFNTALYFLLISLLGLLILTKKTFPSKELCITLITSSILLILIISTLTILLKYNFLNTFNQFHELTFSNDLWLMDERVDNLVNIFPISFFQNITGKIILNSLITSMFILSSGVTGLLFLKRNKNKNSKRRSLKT